MMTKNKSIKKNISVRRYDP